MIPGGWSQTIAASRFSRVGNHSSIERRSCAVVDGVVITV